MSWLDKQVLDVMLATAPVGTGEEMGGKPPGATRRRVPALSGDIFYYTIGSKRSDDRFDVAGIHAPYITRQRIVYLLAIFQAYCGVGHHLPPVFKEPSRAVVPALHASGYFQLPKPRRRHAQLLRAPARFLHALVPPLPGCGR